MGNPGELMNWFSVQRGGRLVGGSSLTTGGDVTADYVGSISNAVAVIARLYRGERRLVLQIAGRESKKLRPDCGHPE